MAKLKRKIQKTFSLMGVSIIPQMLVWTSALYASMEKKIDEENYKNSLKHLTSRAGKNAKTIKIGT